VHCGTDNDSLRTGLVSRKPRDICVRAEEAVWQAVGRFGRHGCAQAKKEKKVSAYLLGTNLQDLLMRLNC
jgi:hypothetical protein